MTETTLRGSMRGHVWLPLAAFAALVLLLEWTRVDVWLADLIYRWEGGAWTLRRDPLVRDLLHDQAGRWIGVFYTGLVATCAASFFVERLKIYRWGFVYLVTAIAVSTLSVALLKDVTRVNCPWSVERWGGELPYSNTWREILAHAPSGRCFPSGHASSGYALLAFYFFCRRYAPALRWGELAVALTLGTLFGVAQQLRGAHYLSHDVWALAICWFVAVAAVPILERASGDSTAARS
jgi:membrane-associated PAP2 superfamily phosphatase